MGIVSFKDTPEQDENRINSVLYPPKNSEVSVVLLLSPPVCQGTIRTIPIFIPPLVYIKNLRSSYEFEYPPSCFNLLMTLLKM